MKWNTTAFGRKCQHPLQMVLGTIPLAVLIIMNVAPELLNRMWALPGACVVLSWGCLVLPGKRRLLGGIIGMVLLMVLGALLLDFRANFLLVSLPVLYSVLLFFTLPIGGWERSRELAIIWHVTGMLFYVLLQLLISGSRKLGPDLYAPVERAVLVCFLLSVCLAVLALNRASLDSAAMSRRTVPVLMRRQNLVVTMGMMVLGVLIAAIPIIGSVLKRVWDWLMQGVAYLANLLMSLLPQNQRAGGGPPAEPSEVMQLGEAREPSALAEFLEKVLIVSVGLLLIAIAVFVTRVLIKKLIRLGKYLWLKLGQYNAAASEDYEDEITDTRDERGVERSSLVIRLRRRALLDEKNMSPAERIRYRYKRMKQKRPDWTAASTARETLPEEAAVLYERVRYSGEELTEEEAGRFRENTRRI